MVVLMQYHDLFERDSRYVDSQWRDCVVLVLVFILVSGIIITYTFFNLMINFNNRCFLNAELVKKDETSSISRETIEDHLKSEYYKEIENQSSGNTTGDQLIVSDAKIVERQSGGQSVMTGFEFSWPAKLLSILGIDDIINPDLESSNTTLTIEDEIDEAKSKWGKPLQCEIYGILTLLHAIVSFTFIILFIMCGRGGFDSSGYLPRPWRILVPALCVFMITTVLSLFFLFLIEVDMRTICNYLYKFANEKKPCNILLGEFALHKDTSPGPSTNYKLFITFIWLITLLWLVASILIVLRILFLIDFQLVKVTISTVESVSKLEEREKKREEERKIMHDLQKLRKNLVKQQEHFDSAMN